MLKEFQKEQMQKVMAKLKLKHEAKQREDKRKMKEYKIKVKLFTINSHFLG
jgi:hypothetical protein